MRSLPIKELRYQPRQERWEQRWWKGAAIQPGMLGLFKGIRAVQGRLTGEQLPTRTGTLLLRMQKKPQGLKPIMSEAGLVSARQAAPPAPTGGPWASGLFLGACIDPPTDNVQELIVQLLRRWQFPELCRLAFTEGPRVCIGASVLSGSSTPSITDSTSDMKDDVKQLLVLLRRVPS